MMTCGRGVMTFRTDWRIWTSRVSGLELLPNMAGFAGKVFAASKDVQLGFECVRAYNDFILDEWCAYAPDRQIPLVMLPYWDVGEATRELVRTAEKGARSATFSEQPHRLGLPSFHSNHWDHLFAAASEHEMPLAMHFGSGGDAMGAAPDGNYCAYIAMMGMNSMAATMDLIMSPVFHKFPRLKTVMAEGGIGWLPYVLEKADTTWERHRWYNDMNREIPPSEVFKGHVYGCFISDQHGVDNLDIIGADSVLFESDYPHSDGKWPHTRKLLAESLLNVRDDDARKVVELNARRIFRFPESGGSTKLITRGNGSGIDRPKPRLRIETKRFARRGNAIGWAVSSSLNSGG